jgi:pyrimidine operon attenuation protein/uracil phosphoribosyltransferase
MDNDNIIMTEAEMRRTVERLAYQIIERHGECGTLAVIGIQRRGADLAERLKEHLDQRIGCTLPLGKLDINLYRDDWTTLSVQPHINKTEISFAIDNMDIILVDDVLYTGRTVRAALEAILDYGRPNRVELLVLVDRGPEHRELPIHADFTGKVVQSRKGEHVDVYIKDRDGDEMISLRNADAGD